MRSQVPTSRKLLLQGSHWQLTNEEGGKPIWAAKYSAEPPCILPMEIPATEGEYFQQRVVIVKNTKGLGKGIGIT